MHRHEPVDAATSDRTTTMNQYQRIIVIVAVADMLLMLLIPPYQETSLLRGAALGFDSYAPLFGANGARPIHRELLTLELIFVLCNALAAWLVMQHSGERPEQRVHYEHGLMIFGAVNLALIFSFPPFEQYSAFIRIEMPRFDGFYFMFGDKMRRHLFIPLLYLECILISVNVLVLYLLFNLVRRSLSATDARLLELAHALPAEKIAELSHALEEQIRAGNEIRPAKVGDRRHHQDPAFAGPERRRGVERRKRPRT
jgi:hypothetical protein